MLNLRLGPRNTAERVVMKLQICKFLRSEEGTTAIEYCMIGAAMCVACVVAMPFITTAITAKFNVLGSSLYTFK
jgi:Flp pilus assembly pilin Flp